MRPVDLVSGDKPGGRNGERLCQRTKIGNLLQATRKSYFSLDTSVTTINWVSGQSKTLRQGTNLQFFRAQTRCRRQGTCEQENPCVPSLGQFNPIPPTRQKSICIISASQHLTFWGMETKATHFQDEKVTQIHIREGEFGMARKVPACPTCWRKAPLASQFGSNIPWVLLSCSMGSTRHLTDWINMPEMCRLGHLDFFSRSRTSAKNHIIPMENSRHAELKISPEVYLMGIISLVVLGSP